MAWNFKDFPELPNSVFNRYYFDSPHKQIVRDFEGVVTKVSDGDTFRVATEFRDFDTVVRMAGVDAPEMSEGGVESREWLSQQIEGRRIDVIVDRSNRVDKWGRILGSPLQNGTDVKRLSLLLGMTVPFDERQRHRRRRFFL